VKVQRPSPGPAGVAERPQRAAPRRVVDEWTGLVLPTRRVSLEDTLTLTASPRLDLLVLDQALERLAALDAPQARIVELRFFGGLTVDETAEAVGVSPASVKRDWALARAWLRRELSRTGSTS
jgi:DNA-directed RNA polymerase specialized sigma24 family protein